MGILNRPSDGSAPVLLTLWRGVKALHATHRTREALLELCSPAAIEDTEGRARKTLTRWTALGLFFEDADGKLQLSDAFKSIPIDGDPLYRRFRTQVRRLVLAPDNNNDFLKPEPSGAADFTLALTWLLSTDVYGDHFSTLDSIQQLEKQQVTPLSPNKYVIQNDTRWAGFRDWAAFLGFGSTPATFQLDPTKALLDEVDGFGHTGERRPIAEFLAHIKQALPVFPGGSYHERARTELGTTTWRSFQDRQVPPSLTRGLYGLEAAGRIELAREADADSVQMLGYNFEERARVSHIRVAEGEAP